ncbi:hypothetical protein PUNSTDRAFT_36080, partial [Punctularia strigosozonata HHB-11173 SS5]|uniref:uncharacterized protein n=1 Tax=Punctularia strigosozonata (strain HHB-11173) TaxID=741275 RepID=UPI0004416853
RSVRKLRNGGIEFEVNSVASAIWLRITKVKASFVENFGDNATIKTRGYPILVESAPVRFNPEDPIEITRVERINGMDEGDILRARWIKAPARRYEGQQYAHLSIVLRTEKTANYAIRWGFDVKGKKCVGRRMMKELIRCHKCQRVGLHMGASCREEKETCGTCGSNEHKTTECPNAEDTNNHFCANCKEKGHAAWSRACPTFIRKNREYQEKYPENNYKYFVTDDPSTW